MQIYFVQPVLIIFTRGAINSEHDCTFYVTILFYFYALISTLI